MVGIKADLTNFLTELWQCVDGKLKVAGVTVQVSTESDLERFVRIEADDRTLLQILGYTKEEVDSQPTDVTIVGHHRFRPDYVLHKQQKPIVVIDVKSPRERLDDPRWVEQIDSYCRIKKVPLGLLFNGVDALLFVNLAQITQVSRAELKEYEKYLSARQIKNVEQLTVQPIMEAQRSDPKKMVELLNTISASELTGRDEAIRKASGIVRLRLRAVKDGIEKGKRQDTIRRRLIAIQEDQAVLEKMLLTACSADKALRTMKPKPSASELLEAWFAQSSVIEVPQVAQTSERSGANPRLKAKLAEVCAVRGWDEGWAKSIKRLRYRLDGVTDKQYKKMKQTPGVPPGLCIPGYSTPDAEFIIEQLDQLLKQ